jgi:hypothetical protein
MSDAALTLRWTAEYARDYACLRRTARSDIRALDEALEGATWLLCRRPQQGCPTAHPGIRALPLDRVATVPALVIYYAYNRDEVLLLALRHADLDADLDL